MSELKEMIADSATRLFEKHATKELVNAAEKGEWAKSLWDSLASHGMLAVGVPEENSGSGGDHEDALDILRLAGRYSAPVPLAETLLANWLLAEAGSLPVDEVLTMPLQFDQSVFHMEELEKGWTVEGTALHVPWARHAKTMLVKGETMDGYVLALLPLQAASIEEGYNMAGEPRDRVVFKDAVLQDISVIPAAGHGIWEKIGRAQALAKSAMMAGALERVLELAVIHAKERSQFGRPLHRFQAIQHHLAALAGETASSGAALGMAVAAFSRSPMSNEIPMAKIRIGEAAGKASRIAHQVVAAIGFTHEHTLHHSTRRLWAWRDECGTESEWQEVLAGTLLTLERNGLWDLVAGTMKQAGKAEKV